MLILDANTTRSRLPFATLIPSLRAAFVAGCEVPLRHNHTVGEGTVLLMPAWSDRYMGVKTVSIFSGNTRRGLPGLHSTYLLYDAATGAPLALIDGNEITSRRTAAASALAASMLARADARKLLVIGAGRVASLLPHAYRAVLPIEQIHIWDIDAAQAQRLAQSLRAEGIDARTTARVADVLSEVDIVTSATLSTVPLIERRHIAPGTHIDLIGGFTPQMREADDACFHGTSVFVDTAEATMKAGDLLHPIAAGMLRAEDVRADLTALCRGAHAGRISNDEITVFKAVGTALEDLAAAAICFEANN